MDINRLPNDKKLQLCRWYFKGKNNFVVTMYTFIMNLIVGCAFLPFVWTVNCIWFFKEAFMKPPFEEQKQIKKYVMLSGGGALIWAVALLSWVCVFQLRRASWGATGDALSFIVPLGRA